MRNPVKHGACVGNKRTREYVIWDSMKKRCFNQNHNRYHLYGGRGITVCERWLKFENFIADMGKSPDGMSLDRIDVNGNYEPGNCRWATHKQQMENRQQLSESATINGVTKTVTEWLKETGVTYNAYWIRTRRRGMDKVTAITKPLRVNSQQRKDSCDLCRKLEMV